VLSWDLSNTLEVDFCRSTLEAALRPGSCEIFNSDQGSQFTSSQFLQPLKDRSIRISMDGRGRALDNVFIERLWRSVKYELIYPGRLRFWRRTLVGVALLFRPLQFLPPASGTGLLHASRTVSEPATKEQNKVSLWWTPKIGHGAKDDSAR
jgi:transposase InsO family protein